MPRKGEVPKRKVLPDPKYSDTAVTKFMNVMMVHGKKGAAEIIEGCSFCLSIPLIFPAGAR